MIYFLAEIITKLPNLTTGGDRGTGAEVIGQSRKYHTILQISLWVVLQVNLTSEISLGLCMICTCNASAPHNFAYTAHIQFVQNKETKKTAEIKFS